VIHSPILPFCLDSFSFPSECPGITFLLSVLMSSSCLPSLTMSSPLIVVHVSQSAQQVHPMPLDVLPSPLSFCLQKKGIVQNDPANHSSTHCQHWRCYHPKARSVHHPYGSLIFHSLSPMQSFSGERPDIGCRQQRWPT
jgi:hypothetical protein